MLKLIKYELRKTWFTKVILLVIAALAEIAFLVGLYGNRENTLVVSIVLLTILAVGGVMVIGLESVITLHRDMNTKQSYMLFMTPNSCYRILGAKLIECGISILLAGAFFFALGTLDLTLLFAREGILGRLWEQIREILSHFTVNGRALELTMRSMAAVTFDLLAAWIFIVSTAYLAVVISAALLNGKKCNGLVSFLIFLLLNWGCTHINTLITDPIRDNVTLMTVYGLIALLFAAGMYFATAVIMERKLSV